MCHCVWGICRPHVAVLDCSDGSHNGGFGIPFWEACKCAAVARDLGDEGRCRIYRVENVDSARKFAVIRSFWVYICSSSGCF